MSEYHEQVAVVKWFRLQYPGLDKAIRLSLNGINLSGGTKAYRIMNQLKAQGLTVGESDLAFLVPRTGYHGLVVEMKTTEGKTTPEQDSYLRFMESLGYFATACYGHQHGIETIKAYMEGNAELLTNDQVELEL